MVPTGKLGESYRLFSVMIMYTVACSILCVLTTTNATYSVSDPCLLTMYPNQTARNLSWISDQDLQTEQSFVDTVKQLAMASSTADIIDRMLINQVYIFHQQDYTDSNNYSNIPGSTALNALAKNLAAMFVTFHLTEIDVSSVEDAFLEMDIMKKENNTFILLANSTQTVSMLAEVQRRNLIGPLYNWVLMALDYDTSYLEIRQVVAPGDRLVTVLLNDIDWHGSTSEDCAVDSEAVVGRLARFGLARFAPIGLWSIENAWNLTADVFPPFRGFYGKVFTITTIPLDYINIKMEINGTTYYFGVFFEVLNAMAQTLKFRYRVIEPEDQLFGAPMANGSWNGMIGMIQRKEVDFACGPFTITADRKEIVDFMYPVRREELAMLVRKPQDDSLSSAFVLIQPFSKEVWICFCFSVVFASLALWVIARVDPEKQQLRMTLMITKQDIWIWRKSFWYSLGTSLAQGGIVPSTSFATFAVVMSIWLMNIILLATYTGNLIAFLSVTKTSMPINSLEELISQNDYKLGVLGNSAHQSIFETANKGFYKEVWNKISSDPGNLVQSIEHGYFKTKQENFVFINEKTMFDILTAVDCDVVMVKDYFLPRGLGYPIQKGSPYTRIFNTVILRILEGGLFEKWREKYLTRNSKCSLTSTHAESKSLGLVGLQGAFILLLIGMSLGSVALLVENIVYRKLYNKIWPSNNITRVQEFSAKPN